MLGDDAFWLKMLETIQREERAMKINSFKELSAYADSLPDLTTVGVDITPKVAVNLCDAWRAAGPAVKFIFSWIKPVIGARLAAVLQSLEDSLDLTCP